MNFVPNSVAERKKHAAAFAQDHWNVNYDFQTTLPLKTSKRISAPLNATLAFFALNYQKKE